MLKKGFAALLLLIVLGILTIGLFVIAYNSKNKKVEESTNKIPNDNSDTKNSAATITPKNSQGTSKNQPTVTSITSNKTATPTYSYSPSAVLTATRTPTHALSTTTPPTPTEKKGGKPTSSAPSTGG
ncbi:MAG: hypothetical protein US62_C0049G0004 [Candidatus Woesebacteria bacterium GW2011_GWA1_37_8]|uniref:Uncharacterized protein n=1 Tax=Candidatus Woesebacteria bacterium GW2011_GWA1_37_8 TaxID=1618546 RepID=A0A0G0KSB0_9BACT|nr:MAG: hypothetical protein US39_C0001G0070 [Microgenomates group bacterium GW2011_GWC1_37_12b]KKQ43466.1 MAG: hypothetical protein US62_C0049G0004 [Candidatus Woesebacteria bacterium GW2011_GWA1_37_8]